MVQDGKSDQPNLELAGWSSVREWIGDFSSPATKDSHYFEFLTFWKWLKANHAKITWENGHGVSTVQEPDDLIRHRKAERRLADDDDVVRNPRYHCEDLVKEFYKALKSYKTAKGEHLADRSRREYVGCVKSWFKHATHDEHSLKLNIKFDAKRLRVNYISVQDDLIKLRRDHCP